MTSLLLSRRDLNFLLFDWLEVEQLAHRPRYAEHSRDTFEAAIDAYADIAHAEFAPFNKTADRNPPQLIDGEVHCMPQMRSAWEAFSGAGLLAASETESHGGMRLPYVIQQAGLAYVAAASPGMSAYALLTMANAPLLLAHASPDQINRFVSPLLDGRWAGTMCLSEPQAGSSLGDITTRAQRQTDGTYRLTGHKMWISGGDQDFTSNIVHLVLAKVADESGHTHPGVAGISLFLVPKYLVSDTGAPGERNDVVVAGLNHKMGSRGTSNCLLNFGEGQFRPGGLPGAVGELVGEEGRGLAYMFHMMNEARISIGLAAAATGYTGFLHAVEYASNRLQGRPHSDRDPAKPPVRIIEHPDVRRMLLAQKALVEGALALSLFSASLVDEQRTAPAQQSRRAHLLLELLTPVAKSWPSKWGVIANDLAIQVHGGYGYTQDFNVEQFYRDNRLNPIHEGTAGIQALDLLGRKIHLEDGAALVDLGKRLQETVARACRFDSLGESALAVSKAWSRLLGVTEKLSSVVDANERLANATAYLDAFGHVVVAWLGLDAATVAAARMGRADEPYLRGKIATCQYFCRWELSRIDRWLGLLDPVERAPLDFQEAWFG